ncbi:MAG: chemotaxis protein CheA [Desulfamplus sp.]|nr:chemotaxis protein CheA [Desulfamplus sp.]
MPDKTIAPDINNSQDNQITLESILEDISLECVLADVSDTESFSKLLALLKIFFQKAKDSNFLELAEDAKKAGKIVKTIMEQKKSDSLSYEAADNDKLSDNMSDIESHVDSVNLIVSEMKSFLHFINRTSDIEPKHKEVQPKIAPEITHDFLKEVEYKETPQNADEVIKTDNSGDTIITDKNGGVIKPHIKDKELTESAPKEINLSHPGQLPAFLNIEDFAEFLSLQSNTLEKMEVLILDIEKNNNRAYAQGELKRIFHTTKGEAGFLGLKDIEKVCHKAEDLMDTQNFGNIVDTLFAVKDWLESTYSVYAGNSGAAPSPEAIIELFNGYNDLDLRTTQLSENDGKEPNKNLTLPDALIFSDRGTTPDSENLIEFDNNITQPEREETTTPVNQTSQFLTESINVDAARLDRMVNIIGELAIAESMVTQSPEITSIASSSLLRALSSLHKITKELQNLGLSLRMVPLKSLFNRMERVTRDLAKKTGKQIHFIIKGESTELDKTLVDKLGDPLIHLVRNSVDHGVEDSIVERIDAGKSATATIELRAFHKGGYLFIEVEDDGRGINRKKLLEKAISQGVIKAASQENEKILSDEILNLVFHPGLTTASKVTDVSGRGVGMDVVRKSIESCRGKVSIFSTEGKGTKCSIKIPLTLSIIDGLVVRVGYEIYVIPTLSIATSLKVDKKDISNVFEKGEMINVLGKLIPLFRLNRLFKLYKEGVNNSFSNLNSASKHIDDLDGVVVVVEDNGFHIALLVDELIGKQNTVIKNLGMGINEIKGVSGGTIMPDGRVSLILDIAGIIELSHSEP